MSDFIIVLAVAILGLLAQAAGGKRVRRLVTVPATAVTSSEATSHQESGSSSTPASDSAAGEIKPPAESRDSAKVKSEIPTTESVKSENGSESRPDEVESQVESTSVLEAKSEIGSESTSAIDEAKSEIGSESTSAIDEVKSEIGSESTPAAHAVEAPKEVKVDSDKVEVLAAVAAATPPIVREEFVMTRKPGIEYFLRITIFLWFIGLSLYYYIANSGLAPAELAPDPWVMQVTFVTCALTGLGLVKGFRTLLSYLLSAIDCLFDIKLLKATAKNWTALKPAFAADRVFIPSSIPHMVGLFIYVQTMFYLLAAMSPKTDFQMPGMPIPLPLPLDQLFSYNGLGLIMLAFCGCGILVTRQFKEVMQRLALVRPTPPQIMIGLGLVFMSFLYDYLWSIYTHGQSLGLDTKLAGYNGGTFTATGGFTGALVLALATAVFAGVGEETLIRGALQPVFGLVPAAILHGVLHAQFQHAPIFIVQVAGWSILMGIAKRYTNTTTTIIGHAGFNFVTSFLFAFNPPDM